jgi:hypothetical protein
MEEEEEKMDDICLGLLITGKSRPLFSVTFSFWSGVWERGNHPVISSGH